MSETNNAINLLVQLGIDTNASKANLDTQIEKLSKQLNNLDIKVDIDKDAIKALNDLSKIDLKGLSDSIKGAGKGLGGIGDEAGKTAKVIERNFKDAQKVLDKTFEHMSADFRKVMRNGISEVDELQKAFQNTDAKFKFSEEILGEDDEGNIKRRVKAITATFTNAKGQIQEVAFEINKLLSDDGKEFKPAWFPSNDIRTFDNELKIVSDSVSKAQQELIKLGETGKISASQMDALYDSLNGVKDTKGLEEYQVKLKDILVTNKNISDTQKQQSKELKEQLAVEEKIRKLQNSIISTQQRDPKGMGSNTELSGMLETLKGINPASDGASKAVKGVSDSFDEMKAKATQAGRDSMSTMDSFRVAMEKFPIWMAASTVFFQSLRGIKSAITNIVELDSQMTVLRRVAGDGVDANRVLQESVRLAGELGNEISDINEGFIAFARQGFRGEDLSMLAEVSTLLGNISDLSVDDAASTITAALKGFNLEAEKSIHVVDAMNEVDNNYSITTSQLATAMQRSAGAASTYGVSLERTIGKRVADVKSLLIDLELLTVLQKDNRAQAELFRAA